MDEQDFFVTIEENDDQDSSDLFDECITVSDVRNIYPETIQNKTPEESDHKYEEKIQQLKKEISEAKKYKRFDDEEIFELKKTVKNVKSELETAKQKLETSITGPRMKDITKKIYDSGYQEGYAAGTKDGKQTTGVLKLLGGFRNSQRVRQKRFINEIIKNPKFNEAQKDYLMTLYTCGYDMDVIEQIADPDISAFHMEALFSQMINGGETNEKVQNRNA